jgi:hypothetical protein
VEQLMRRSTDAAAKLQRACEHTSRDAAAAALLMVASCIHTWISRLPAEAQSRRSIERLRGLVVAMLRLVHQGRYTELSLLEKTLRRNGEWKVIGSHVDPGEARALIRAALDCMRLARVKISDVISSALIIPDNDNDGE